MQFWEECYDGDGKVIPDLAWNQVRRLRNELLTRCDWTDLPHAPLSDEQQAAWQKYRQALRDVTEQEIDEIIWPEDPSE